ncbi:apses-domain-containing protein [Parathielavia hyrcaniae]|uniref:Apses-domain-containing protein n=1 Tax=Parathielavia hyrcaniae TaxID=113614 RepID=A0AAN6Q663_9PEZI|nr:apses-domain-containing protein [Parathielavia hyrcaniae]
MYYPSHMSAGQAPPPQTVTSAYPHQQPHPHSQPPQLQPVPGHYPPPQYGSQYGYANAMTSAAGQPAVSNQLSAPQPVLPLPGISQSGMSQSAYANTFDTTGQVAPVGMKPRVTATLWEDEGSLCFQVEARGICVARREDNHMINGTKLLNVAGMTRGRRDGILKSEKVRHVVKIGPMHLKGVWIPFERALDFANKEKITELLYPLFVHNIGALLCHPTNSARTSQVMAAAQRRPGQNPPGLPSLQQPHPPLALPGPQSQLPSHPQSMGRPSMDRGHSFPTPPSSAVMSGMSSSDGYPWNQQGMSNGQQSSHISIDTSLGNSNRSLPNTPATTPPGSSIQSMQSYPPVSQPYDNSRPMYQHSGAPPPSYPPPSSGTQERPMYGHGSYVKSEMGPPSARAGVPNGEQVESKPVNGMMHNGQGEVMPAAAAEEEADHDHEAEYTHNSGGYDTNRSSYNYSAPAVASLQNDHSHLSPEMSGSPHQAGSGRATPRTATAPQSYYAPQGYSTPPRVGQASSNLYSVMSNERASANGTSTNDVYGNQGDMGAPMQNGYSTQPPPILNGGTSMKRGRDDDDDRSDLKRRKGMLDGPGSMPSPTFNNPMAQPTAAVGSQRRR